MIENIDIQIISQIAIAIGIILIFRILRSFVASYIIKIMIRNNKKKINVKKNPFYLPIKTIFTFIGIYIALNVFKNIIEINATSEVIITKIIKIALIIFVAKAFGEGLDEKNGAFIRIKTKKNQELDETTTLGILKTIKIIIYIIAGFLVIYEWGYDLTGLIASLGIGGIVITLAAQDTAKSVIGGIAIFLDKPFKKGDYIKIGQYEGTVEDIKFRTTNIRTLDNSVLHIPNSEMSISAIINYSEMEKRRYYTKITLEFDTKLEKVENMKIQIEKMLQQRNDILKDTISVKFQNISDNGMEIIIIAYINETNYENYLEIKEKINYEIMTILQKENISLAYNMQTIYLKNS